MNTQDLIKTASELQSWIPQVCVCACVRVCIVFESVPCCVIIDPEVSEGFEHI